MGDRRTTRIVILGGGFAGVAAARRLERLHRRYYLFQMPRWDRRLRIVLDSTVALFFRPDITKVDLTMRPQPSIPPEPAAYLDIHQTRVASG